MVRGGAAGSGELMSSWHKNEERGGQSTPFVDTGQQRTPKYKINRVGGGAYTRCDRVLNDFVLDFLAHGGAISPVSAISPNRAFSGVLTGRRTNIQPTGGHNYGRQMEMAERLARYMICARLDVIGVDRNTRHTSEPSTHPNDLTQSIPVPVSETTVPG